MNLLEMFSGTGSVGLVAKSLGFNVISLDLKNADINTDILKWDYKQFDKNHFGFYLGKSFMHGIQQSKKLWELGILNMQIV